MLSSRVAIFAFSLLPALVLANDHIKPLHNAHIYREQNLSRRQDSRNFTLTDSMEGATFFECVLPLPINTGPLC